MKSRDRMALWVIATIVAVTGFVNAATAQIGACISEAEAVGFWEKQPSVEKVEEIVMHDKSKGVVFAKEGEDKLLIVAFSDKNCWFQNTMVTYEGLKKIKAKAKEMNKKKEDPNA